MIKPPHLKFSRNYYNSISLNIIFIISWKGPIHVYLKHNKGFFFLTLEGDRGRQCFQFDSPQTNEKESLQPQYKRFLSCHPYQHNNRAIDTCGKENWYDATLEKAAGNHIQGAVPYVQHQCILPCIAYLAGCLDKTFQSFFMPCVHTIHNSCMQHIARAES